MRRLPPQQIEKNLSDLIDLVPHLCEDLLSSVDQPLKIANDKESGRDYVLCDYNRDGDSYRYYYCTISLFINLLKPFLLDLHGQTHTTHPWMMDKCHLNVFVS